MSASRGRGVWLPAALAGLLCGCSTEGLVFRAPDYRAPERIAVLPFDNETTSLQAPDMLRRFTAEELPLHGAVSLPLDETDRRLKAIGITDGGQLKAYAAADLGRALEADGLLYGTVEDYTNQNVGFFRRRLVRLRLRMASAPGGGRLWEAVGSGSDEKVSIRERDAIRSFLKGLAEQALEGAAGIPLEREARLAVKEAFKAFPGR
jgi:hypothetical protein